MIIFELFTYEYIAEMNINISMLPLSGTTQSLLPLLEEFGIEAMSVGVNAVTSPPSVPPIFNWKFQNTSIIGLWHPGLHLIF